MKIILTNEVPNLGAPGDIVEVKDGYGRNYLLPQGFAIAWTKGAEKQVETIKRARAAARSATSATPTRSRPSSRASRSPCRRAPARVAASSVRSPPTEIVDAVKAGRRPGAGQAQDRAARPDQDHRRLPGADQAAPGRRRPSST